MKWLIQSGKYSLCTMLMRHYTIVCFWDPTCGHCREEVPRMDSIYHAKWKNEGVKIYGVLTETKELDQMEGIYQ